MDRIKRILLWAGQRGVGFWLANTFGTVALTYMAVVAEILVDYAPFSYGVIALGSFLLINIGYAIYSWAHSNYMLLQFEDRRSKSASINPLLKDFKNKRINATDFYHPFLRRTEDAVFRDCEFFGPATLWFTGCSFKNPLVSDCDYVVVKEGSYSTTITAFHQCKFENCRFYRITWFVDPLMLADIRKQLGSDAKHLNVMTYESSESGDR